MPRDGATSFMICRQTPRCLALEHRARSRSVYIDNGHWRTDDSSTSIVRRGEMKKLLCIITAAMALIVAASAAMAEPKSTHRMKSPRSVPAPLRQWPPNNPTFREYEELKRQGWYKADKA